MKSPKTPRILRYDSLNFEQSVNKSSEHVFREMEGSEATDPPESSTTLSASGVTGNWGITIDRGARVLFPLIYLIFTVMYFVVMFKFSSEVD